MRRVRQLRNWFAAGLAVVLLGGMLASVLAGGAARAAAPPADPPALAMSSSVSPSPLVVGGTAVYTVTVRNTGGLAADAVVTTLPFSGGTLTFGTLPAACFASGQTVTCKEPSIAPGGSVSYTIPVTLSPSLSDGTNIALRGVVTASNAPAANSQLITQAFTRVDVEIVKTGPATVNPNGTITYTITVINHGPSDAVSVTWHDPTDGNLTTITSYPCGNTGLTVSCTVGTMAPGESRTYTITSTVNPSVAAGTVIANCAVVYTGTSPETNPDNNQSCVNTTVTGATPPVSHIEIVKTAPATVQEKGTIDYSVTVTNHGPDPATNVIVTDPVNVPYSSASALPAGCAFRNAVITCTIGALGVGENRVFAMSVTISGAAVAGTNIVNCAAVTSSNNEVVQNPNPSCVQTQVVPAPVADVAALKSGPATAGPDDTFEYTLTVTNNGPDEAAHVTVTDPVDTSLLTVVGVSPGCAVDGGTVTCDAGTLAAGTSRDFTVSVRVNHDDAPGTQIRNCEAVATSTHDPNVANTSSCVTTLVDPPVPVAEVEVDKSGPATAAAGGTISYTVTATNHGPDNATDVVVKDPVDTSLLTVTSLSPECTNSAGTVLCDAGTIAVGETKTFTITVTVADGIETGTHIDNCAGATSVSTVLNPVPQPDCAETVVVPSPTADVAVTKTAPLAVSPGGVIGYTLTVTNKGPDAARHVTITDPVNTALVTVTSLPASCSDSAGRITCEAGTLGAGDSRVLTITVQVNPNIQGLVIPNCAQAYTTTRDTDLDNNLSCANTVVGNAGTAHSVLEVVKHGPATANAGSVISYSVDVTNRGPDDASSVVITDAVDPSLVSVVSLPNDCVLDGAIITCLPGALAVGQTTTLAFAVRIAAAIAPGTAITNCTAAGSELAAVREKPNPSCVQTVVVPAPMARVVVTKNAPQTVRPGGTLGYSGTVTNLGPDPAQNVILVDPVQHASLLTITSMPSVCTLAGGTVTCRLGTLAPGQTVALRATIRINGDVAANTVLGNCAAAYGSTENPDIEHAQSCVNTIVVRKAAKPPFVPVTG